MTVLRLKVKLNFVFKTQTSLDNSFSDIPSSQQLEYLIDFKFSTEGHNVILHQLRAK